MAFSSQFPNFYPPQHPNTFMQQHPYAPAAYPIGLNGSLSNNLNQQQPESLMQDPLNFPGVNNYDYTSHQEGPPARIPTSNQLLQLEGRYEGRLSEVRTRVERLESANTKCEEARDTNSVDGSRLISLEERIKILESHLKSLHDLEALVNSIRASVRDCITNHEQLERNTGDHVDRIHDMVYYIIDTMLVRMHDLMQPEDERNLRSFLPPDQ